MRIGSFSLARETVERGRKNKVIRERRIIIFISKIGCNFIKKKKQKESGWI
jgi:hypothetical protein